MDVADITSIDMSRSSNGSGGQRKPRVLFLDQTGQLGGAELFLADVAARYSKRGAVVLFQDGPFRGMLEKSGVSVSVVPLSKRDAAVGRASGFLGLAKAGPQFLSVALQVARKARGFDLIYANTAKALMVGSLAAILSRRPLVYHLHDIISAEHFSAFNRRLLVAFGNRAQAVIANSEATRRCFIESGGRRGLTHVVYNGFDARLYAEASADDRAHLRLELGIGDAPCVLMVGRLSPWKGQHLFLEALRTLPGVHGVIAGDALFTEEDHKYAEQLMKVECDPELARRVHFLGFRGDLPRWYAMADLVVHASTAPEPFGRVIVEGMLAGKPVIATRGGGASEILSDRNTGHLVTPNDAQEIAAAIRMVLAAPGSAAAMGERARDHARRKFPKESVLVAMDGIIESLVPAPRKGWWSM